MCQEFPNIEEFGIKASDLPSNVLLNMRHMRVLDLEKCNSITLPDFTILLDGNTELQILKASFTRPTQNDALNLLSDGYFSKLHSLELYIEIGHDLDNWLVLFRNCSNIDLWPKRMKVGWSRL
jgi:hypothetical protein